MEITFDGLWEMYSNIPKADRGRGQWVMNGDTRDRIATLAGVSANDLPATLFGLPIEIRPDAVGIRFEAKPEARLIRSEQFHDALVAAGVIRAGERIRRIVIDAKVGEVPVIHVERYGDERLLEVVRGLDGVEVRESRAVPTGKITHCLDPIKARHLASEIEKTGARVVVEDGNTLAVYRPSESAVAE